MSRRQFPNGTEVFFWDTVGEVCYGIVQSNESLPDVCGHTLLAL